MNCPNCDGSGRVTTYFSAGAGHDMPQATEKTCAVCEGCGRYSQDEHPQGQCRCTRCHGSGKRYEIITAAGPDGSVQLCNERTCSACGGVGTISIWQEEGVDDEDAICRLAGTMMSRIRLANG